MEKEIIKASIKTALDKIFPDGDWSLNVDDNGTVLIEIKKKS
jgi:hypothetical protein